MYCAGTRKTEVLGFSMTPETKSELKALAEEQEMGTSEHFWEMVRIYEDYQEEKKLRRL